MRFPVSSAELNRRETVGSTPEVKLQAAKAFANPPPAIVQASQLTPGQFKAEVTVCVRMWGQYTDRLLELYESFTKRWEDFGRTRDLAAEEVFGSSWHAIKDKLRRLTDAMTAPESCAPRTMTEQQENEKALSEVEKSRFTCKFCGKPISGRANHFTGMCKECHDKLPPKDADEWEEKEHFIKPELEEKPKVEAYEPPRDASGCVIPQALLDLRERRQEVTEAEHHASKLGALLEKVQNDGSDLLWRHLKETGSLQTWLHAVQTVRFNLAECLPDVVCPQCNGKGCQYCCGSGWISEVRWNRDYVKSHDSQKLAIVAKRNGHA